MQVSSVKGSISSRQHSNWLKTAAKNKNKHIGTCLQYVYIYRYKQKMMYLQ
jgi:hypothetical protein